MMITVIEYRQWQREDGKIASFYGAVPWVSDAERQRWSLVSKGWTWRDGANGTVGLSRPPAATKDEADAVAAKFNAARAATRAAQTKAWAPVNAPVNWTKTKNNAGETIHHSGEGWSIRAVAGCFQIEAAGDEADFPAFRTIKKAREWAERMIRGERQERTFA